MRNKFLTKILGATLGLAMAFGVGVGVANYNNKVVKEVNADAGDVFGLASSVSADDLVTLVGVNSESYYSSAAQGSNNRSGVAVTHADGRITAVATTSVFRVQADTNDGEYWNLYDVSAEKYLYNASTSEKSYLRSKAYADEDAMKWSITIASGSNKATISSKSTTRRNIRFNYNNGSPLFNCYASGQSDVYIYKKLAKYTVTYNAGDGTGDDYVVNNVISGTSHTLVNFIATGFTAPANKQFKCWSISSTEYDVGASYTVTANTTVTAVYEDLPSEPFINLTLTSSNNAFTGQTVTVSAEYGNGVTGLTWTTPVGTVSNVVSSNSAFSAKIGGSTGTLTIRATDNGSALYDEVSVSVTKTTVSLNKNTTSIGRQASETLTATTNVGGVSWNSNNSKVTVSDSGVVSVLANAVVGSTATITATSNVDESVSASCTVKVLYYPLGVISVVRSGLSNSYGTNEEKIFNDIKFNVNNVANMTSSVQFKNASTAGFYNKDSFGKSISKVEFAFNTNNSASLVSNQVKEAGNPNDLKGALKVLFSAKSDFSEAETIQVFIAEAGKNETVTIAPTIERAFYAKVLSNNIGAVYCDSISFSLTILDSYFESVSPVATTVGDNALRFGARILKTDWASIETKAGISDYGVMVFRQKNDPASYSETPVEDAHNESKTLTIAHKGNGTAPGTEGDYYEFTVKINITDEANKDIVFYSAPFIVAGGQYYFLCEMQYSFNSLAA